MTEARAERGRRASGQVTDEPEIYDYMTMSRHTQDVDEEDLRITSTTGGDGQQ